MEINNFLKNHNGISFHMPAHKNRVDFTLSDITEIYGADNLRCPDGIIMDSQKKASEFLGVKEALYLVNGASSGLISSVASLGKTTVTVDKNCHESVIYGLIISGGMPEFVYPQVDEAFHIPSPLSKDNITKKSDNLVYTSTTYFGKACDNTSIKEKLSKNAVVISDEAHGAHFYFSDSLKKYRADKSSIGVLSFHKSLPTLTSGAVLSIKNDNINHELLVSLKNLVTTTSPSYPVMASIEYAFEKGKAAYENSELLPIIDEIKESISKNTNILIYNSDDPWKLLLNFSQTKISASECADILREKYNIYIEGVFSDNILFMISPYNTKEELLTLKKAIILIGTQKGTTSSSLKPQILKTETVITPREAFFAEGKTVSPDFAVGKISKENITPFPPCIPIITMGEIITEEIAHYLKEINRYITIVK